MNFTDIFRSVMRNLSFIAVSFIVASSVISTSLASAQTLDVFAAASLKPALDEIAAHFEE